MNTYILYRCTEINGCVFEDGSDTRKETSTMYLIPASDEEQFNECIADDYGNQDYSYQIQYNEIGRFTEQELVRLGLKISEMKLEEVAQ